MGLNKKKTSDTILQALKYLIDNIPYAVWIKGSDGIYRYSNERASANMDLLPEEVVGRNDYEITTKEIAETLLAEDKKLLNKENKSQKRKIRFTTMDRNIYEITGMVIQGHKDNGVQLIGGIGYDVTLTDNLYKEIEKGTLNLLDDSKEKVKSELPYILQDMLEADGITIFILNEQKTRLQVFSKTYDDSVMPKDYSIQLSDRVKKMCIDGKKFTECLNTRIKKSTCNEFIKTYFIHFEDEFIGILNVHYKDKNLAISIQEDIISRTCDRLGVIIKNRLLTNKYKEELKRRKETERKLKIFLENTIDFYVMIKDDKLYFEDEKNKQMFEKFFGYSADEIEERRNKGILRCLEDEKKMIDVLQAAKTCRKIEGVVIKYICANNQYKSIEWNVAYIEEEDNYFISGNDVTEEEKLRKEKMELQKTVEVESLKTQFFANMSHEFKTPLNIILTTVQVLLGKMDNDENNYNLNYKKLEKYLKGIKQNSYRLLKIVNNIMDINKIDSGSYNLELGNYNIVNVVEDIVMSVVSYMEYNKRNIVFDTVDEEIITACDPVKIERIILNLLSNSLKYTYENGNIEVLINKNVEKNQVIISVVNDGDPISDEDKEKIFNRFTQSEATLSRRREGTGIGLFLVKLLVEMHGGTIYVDNNEKAGVKFVITLPIRYTDSQPDNSAYNKEIISKVEVCDIEFSDIYSNDTTYR